MTSSANLLLKKNKDTRDFLDKNVIPNGEGRQFTLHDDIFNPELTTVTPFFAQAIYDHLMLKRKDLSNLAVCDMMTGSGIISLLLHNLGIQDITASDLNPNAIGHNIMTSNENVRLLLSNLYENDCFKGELFNYIFANPPLLFQYPEDLTEEGNFIVRAMVDLNGEINQALIEESKNYLQPGKENGLVIVGSNKNYLTVGDLLENKGYMVDNLARLLKPDGEEYTVYRCFLPD